MLRPTRTGCSRPAAQDGRRDAVKLWQTVRDCQGTLWLRSEHHLGPVHAQQVCLAVQCGWACLLVRALAASRHCHATSRQNAIHASQVDPAGAHATGRAASTQRSGTSNGLTMIQARHDTCKHAGGGRAARIGQNPDGLEAAFTCLVRYGVPDEADGGGRMQQALRGRVDGRGGEGANQQLLLERHSQTPSAASCWPYSPPPACALKPDVSTCAQPRAGWLISSTLRGLAGWQCINTA